MGSGLDATRPKLLKALSRPQFGFIVVEHREVDDELVCNMTEVLTGFCARLHGRRLAERRAHEVMEAARQ